MNLEGSFLLLVALILGLPLVGLVMKIVSRILGRERIVSGLLALLLLPGILLGASLYLDTGTALRAGTVVVKEEQIRYPEDDDGRNWNRSLSIGVQLESGDYRGVRATPLSVRLSPEEFDRIRKGDRVMVRCLLIGPAAFGRLATHSTLSWIPRPTTRGIALVGGAIFLLVLWRAGWRRRLLALAGVMWLAFVLWPRFYPVAAAAGPRLRATATVRKIQRTPPVGQRRLWWDANQPYEVVELSLVPPGRNEAVLVVDTIDAESIPGLAAGKTVGVTYPASDPRAADIAGGSRTYTWKNPIRFCGGLIVILLAVAAFGLLLNLAFRCLVRTAEAALRVPQGALLGVLSELSEQQRRSDEATE